jgi:hypothetical protein
MALVNRHRRLDNNNIFYVGISKDYKRPYSVGRYRNKIWNNIVNKTNYSVEIIYDNLSYDDAIELEIFLIHLYGKINNKTGVLANITDGGEGTIGVKPWCTGTKGLVKPNKGSFKKGHKTLVGKSRSIESRLKQSIRQKGVKPKCTPPDFSKMCLDTHTGIFYDSLNIGCAAVNIRPNTEASRISRKSKLQRFIYV